ncbi:hypothetical protein [Phytohabitans kaempferiae]|uniref:Uncharacterized protein n=1 Tax=Phytohabitans kaempferiae TaxID=1620943 RepID=A0ABV6LZF4_9ACTN
MITTEERPVTSGALLETAGEDVKRDGTPDTQWPDDHWWVRNWVCGDLTSRQMGLLRAMLDTGPCRYTGDGSCFMCSGASLADMLRATDVHGLTLRYFGRDDIAAIRRVLERTAADWLQGKIVG